MSINCFKTNGEGNEETNDHFLITKKKSANQLDSKEESIKKKWI